MRILVISDISPYPLVSGDRIREYNLLRRLADQHEVWLTGFMENPSDEYGVPHLASFCAGVEVVHTERHHPLYHIPGLLKYALSGRPLELKFLHSEKLIQKIRKLLTNVHFDLVMVINSHTALYWELLPPDLRQKSVLVFENIEFSQYESIYRIENDPINKMRAWINLQMMRNWEPRYAGHFNRCITVSENDKDILTRANPDLKVDVIPNGVDTKIFHPLATPQGRADLLFIGKMSYAPCADAADYFSYAILPLIKREVENTRLWIVGREPPQKVLNLANGDDIQVTGWVQDVLPYYERCAICVVPLRAGGGTRLKILEAMALGRPVVSTSVGCEGIDVTDGVNILIADYPDDFAEKTVKLLRDENLQRVIAQNARKLVESQYDWDSIARKMMNILHEVA